MDSGPSADFVKHFASDHDRLFAYIYTLLPRRADAEDVFQRVSMILWQKFDAWDRGAPFLSWACGVAFYEVRNFLRVSSRDRLRFGDALLETLARERAAALKRRDERAAGLEACLDGLEPADRQLVRSAHEEGEGVAGLARRRGQAVQTLYNRLCQLRRRLLECVDGRTAAGEGGA
jgi:RNA polymerase sigma-70 factor